MNSKHPAALLASTAALALPIIALSAPAHAATTSYKNCTALHKTYAHGVGRSGAKDKTSGTPVTSFTKSTKTYNAVIKHNTGLDRDHDGIACEAR